MRKLTDGKIPYVITYMLNLQYGTNELLCETETETQIKRTDLWLPRDKMRGGMNWEFGISDASCYIAVQSLKLCVTLCNPMDCNSFTYRMDKQGPTV